LKQTIGGSELEWNQSSPRATYRSKSRDQPSDYAIAYAWAEIELPEKTKEVLGIGSDDAVKVWLNGNWSMRMDRPPLRSDDDVVPVDFAAGKNQLLLKVQNIRGDWSFACRL